MRCVANAHGFYLIMSIFLISSRPSGGGIVRQLPQEARRFAAIDKIYEKVHGLGDVRGVVYRRRMLDGGIKDSCHTKPYY